jgi:hypothetical protein
MRCLMFPDVIAYDKLTDLKTIGLPNYAVRQTRILTVKRNVTYTAALN